MGKGSGLGFGSAERTVSPGLAELGALEGSARGGRGTPRMHGAWGLAPESLSWRQLRTGDAPEAEMGGAVAVGKKLGLGVPLF